MTTESENEILNTIEEIIVDIEKILQKNFGPESYSIETLRKPVKKIGNSSHVMLPKKWVGCEVIVVKVVEIVKEEDDMKIGMDPWPL